MPEQGGALGPGERTWCVSERSEDIETGEIPQSVERCLRCRAHPRRPRRPCDPVELALPLAPVAPEAVIGGDRIVYVIDEPPYATTRIGPYLHSRRRP
jgi:hypothetical protein